MNENIHTNIDLSDFMDELGMLPDEYTEAVYDAIGYSGAYGDKAEFIKQNMTKLK